MPDEVIAWVDADGVETVLTDQSDVEVEYDVEGRFMPPVAFSSEVVPFQPGERLRQTRFDVREVLLPTTFLAADASALRTSLRNYLGKFDPTRGDGKLKVTAPDGSQRELSCRYAGGMELVEPWSAFNAGWQRAVLTFRAFDPYWYDATDRVSTYTTGGTATFFPFFPLRLSSSEVFTDATVDNAGDVEAWPVWTITGPGSNPVLRNLTTGKVLSLTYTLTAGQVITIDTTPGVKTVTLDDGTNLFGNLSSTSSLWPLQDGSNSVRIELTSATADSEVKLTYRRRYLGA